MVHAKPQYNSISIRTPFSFHLETRHKNWQNGFRYLLEAKSRTACMHSFISSCLRQERYFFFFQIGHAWRSPVKEPFTSNPYQAFFFLNPLQPVLYYWIFNPDRRWQSFLVGVCVRREGCMGKKERKKQAFSFSSRFTFFLGGFFWAIETLYWE